MSPPFQDVPRQAQNIGKPRGFDKENTLRYQMLQRRQCLAGVVLIRVGHGLVFAHAVHPAHGAIVYGVHDFNHAKPYVGVWLTPSDILKLQAGGIISNGLVIQIYNRDQPRVGCALHVVLSS